VRIFGRNRVPAGLEGAPYRPGGPTQDADTGGEASTSSVNGAVGFRHDATYRHVWIDEREFSLTQFQSDIVRELHRAALEGQPWVRVEQLRAAVGFESDKLAHLFRRMKNRRELILSDQRGYYRLNV
jgi:hypothetical protein